MRPMPVTVEDKLADIIRRLGHIEKHLIDIREAVQPEPGKPQYVIDRSILG